MDPPERPRLVKHHRSLPITDGMGRFPLVSVVVPAFNYADYLTEALDSALAQDWPALEVIVVDDGSTDATPEVIASYGERVRALRRPNGGLNAATGSGIAEARGEFLTFLDADDRWRPERVRLLADALLAHPRAGLVWGDMEIVDDQGRVTSPSFRRTFGIQPLSGRVLGRLLEGNFISAGSLMVRAALKERFHPIPEVAAWQDWWIAARVAEVADVQAIAEPVNLYRQHDRNMNLGAQSARLAGLFRTELPFRRWLLQNVAPDAATSRQWATAVAALDASLSRAGEDGSDDPVLEERSADLHRAELGCEEGRRALEQGDPALAVARLAGAIGAWPLHARARALLADALPLAIRQDEPAEQPRPEVRGTVTFASIEQLESQPRLLADYGRQVDASADATLVVGGVDHHGAVERLKSLIADAGLDSDGAADVLALPAHDPSSAAAEIGRPIDRALASTG